jgi:hypothetical protein
MKKPFWRICRKGFIEFGMGSSGYKWGSGMTRAALNLPNMQPHERPPLAGAPVVAWESDRARLSDIEDMMPGRRESVKRTDRACRC